MTERSRSLLFHGFVATGILVGATATVIEIVDRPPVRLGSTRPSRDGGVSRVQVLAKNHSESVPYCVEIRIGAYDPDGLDLQDEVVAEPRQGDGRLRPGQSMNFVAYFEDISDQQFAEELDEFRAYVADREAC